jgi:hypothetical protein
MPSPLRRFPWLRRSAALAVADPAASCGIPPGRICALGPGGPAGDEARR